MAGYRSMGFVDVEMGIEMDRQLFVLGKEIWSSASRDDVMATAQSMHSAGIYAYPYDEFDLIVCGETRRLVPWLIGHDRLDRSARDALKDDSKIATFSLRYYELSGPNYKYSMGIKNGDGWIYLPGGSAELLSSFSSMAPEVARYMNDLAADAMLSTLVVLLATRNIKKDILDAPKRFRDPASQNGVKQIRNKEYRYITTIKIGEITKTMRADGSREPVRPHLRRGHIRNQRIGEGRKDVKRIFIQPVFVNADEGWIEGQRAAYRIKA